MIKDVIIRIRTEMIDVFREMDRWFDKDDRLLNYDPSNGGWSVKKILEHVSLTNHFLLVLIRKGTNNALRNAAANNFQELNEEYEFNWVGLISIGNHMSFQWQRPEHMEPSGQISIKDINTRLDSQLMECLSYLDQMPYGEGTLYKTMMSVTNLGKIDVYHYIYFLVQHAKRHITQMKKVEIEFKTVSK
jgi:hypothetical protein